MGWYIDLSKTSVKNLCCYAQQEQEFALGVGTIVDDLCLGQSGVPLEDLHRRRLS